MQLILAITANTLKALPRPAFDVDTPAMNLTLTRKSSAGFRCSEDTDTGEHFIISVHRVSSAEGCALAH